MSNIVLHFCYDYSSFVINKKKVMKKIIKISVVLVLLVVLFIAFFAYSGNAEKASQSTALLGSVLSVFTVGFLS
jgi:hypothetical protein